MRRRRYAAVVTSLSIATIALLLFAYVAPAYWRDLAINVGASIIIVIASYLIFNPLIEGARAVSTREHPRLDLNDFIDHIANAAKDVYILDTWTRLLDPHLRNRCFAVMRESLQSHVVIRILLLDPESKAAEQRTEEIGHHADVPLAIMQTLFHLYQFRQGLSADLANSFQVRIYSASPSVQLYRWDDRAFLSFFPIGRGAHETPKLETHMLTPWGQFVQRRFEELWNDSRTLALDNYMRMPVEVVPTGNIPEQIQVSFVWVDGICYVSDPSLLKHMARYGSQNLTVRSMVAGPGEADSSSSACGLTMLDDRSESARVVLERFVSKYGRAHDFVMVLAPNAIDDQ